MIDEPKRAELLKKLESLVNRLSLENESDTPDWILARYMVGCLDTFDACVRERDRWFGIKPWEDGRRVSDDPSPSESTEHDK